MDRIPLFHFPIDLTAFSRFAFLLHLPGRYAFVDRWLPVQSLPRIGTMVDLFLLFQILVAVLCPGCSPPFRILPVVPVVRRNVDLLPKIFRSFPFPNSRFLFPVFIKQRQSVLRSMFPVLRVIRWQRRVKYSPAFRVPGIGKNCFCLLLPLSVIIKTPHCQHNMSMGVAVPFVMQCPVSDHAF